VSRPALTIGVSLKMYFGQRQTVDWCRAVAALAERHPAITGGAAELFVLPAAPMIDPVLRVFDGLSVGVGAQDLYGEDSGAFTGEVSGALLREMGCRYAEVGHAERRRLFGEDNATAAAKVAACWRNRLTPVLCVGESRRGTPGDAATACVEEAREVLGGAAAVLADAARPGGRVILAYEPHWAIGRPEPAPAEHIAEVTAALRVWLAGREEFAGSPVIYGGSAGGGLLTSMRDHVDGLFLGRFAHDPAALETILDEALATGGARSSPKEMAGSEKAADERALAWR
jgi:triosephosphate isomerase